MRGIGAAHTLVRRRGLGWRLPVRLHREGGQRVSPCSSQEDGACGMAGEESPGGRGLAAGARGGGEGADRESGVHQRRAAGLRRGAQQVGHRGRRQPP